MRNIRAMIGLWVNQKFVSSLLFYFILILFFFFFLVGFNGVVYRN